MRVTGGEGFKQILTEKVSEASGLEAWNGFRGGHCPRGTQADWGADRRLEITLNVISFHLAQSSGPASWGEG